MRLYIFYVLFSFFIITVAEADNLSIDEIVQKTLNNNPELKFYEHEIDAAKADKAASTLLTNPEFETIGGRKTEGTGEGSVWGVEITQAFEYPGRRKLRESIANRKVASAELNLEQFKAGLAAKARSVAYQLLFSQQLANVTREISKQGEALIKILEGRETAGTIPLLEMRIIEANIISLQKKALDAEQAVQSAELDLKQLTGDSLSKNIKVSPSELNLKTLPSVDSLVAEALKTNFDIRGQSVELSTQELNVELSKNEKYPGFKVGSFFAEENAEGTQRISGIKFSIPLSFWNNN